MEYNKKSDLKVECIVSKEDFDFFGVTLDDILERTQAGIHFLKKVKELCAMTQGVTWTNIAYTLNITVLGDGSVALEFSECISDYVASLKHSMMIASEETKTPLEDFINALEDMDDEHCLQLEARFEKNTREEL